MPSAIPSLDDQFPTLRGDESPREMFSKIVNYLFVMKESLDYTLANLSADNWNTVAWNEMTDEAQAPVTKLAQELSRLATLVAQHSISVNDLTRDMGSTKDRVTVLEGRTSDLDYLLEEIVKLGERLEKIESVIQLEEEPDAVTIGKENVPLRLVGEVSINGVQYEEGQV